jgi:hypothetical protein
MSILGRKIQKRVICHTMVVHGDSVSLFKVRDVIAKWVIVRGAKVYFTLLFKL